MPAKFARASGNFNHNIWSDTPTGATGSAVPSVGDVAIANNYTVSITGNIACDALSGISTGMNITSSGGFLLFDESSITCNAIGIIGIAGITPTYPGLSTVDLANKPAFVTYIGEKSAVINAKDITGVQASGACNIKSLSGGTLFINATRIFSGFTTYPIVGQYYINSPIILNNGFGTINITCPELKTDIVTDAGDGRIRYIENINGEINVYGNVYGTIVGVGQPGVIWNARGNVNIYGNVIGDKSPVIRNESSACTLNVFGDVTSGRVPAIIGQTYSTSTLIFSNINIEGNLYYTLNCVPVYAGSYNVTPTNNKFIKYASLRSEFNNNSDYMYQFPDTVISTFSKPAISSVRSGVAFGTSLGTCNIPSQDTVAFGVTYDSNNTKIGTAVNTSNFIFNTSIVNLSTTNSFGDKLKKAATAESAGHLIASFSN